MIPTIEEILSSLSSGQIDYRQALIWVREHLKLAGDRNELRDRDDLRDEFAARAMQSLIASRHTDYEGGWYAEDRVAENAYKMADAMLAKREAA